MLFIKQQLHDPASAKFGHSNEAVVRIEGSRAMVIRSVRAVNGYGAVRTVDFMCLMELKNGVIMPVLVTERGGNTAAATAILKKWKMLP